jgi:hypothetical protein
MNFFDLYGSHRRATVVLFHCSFKKVTKGTTRGARTLASSHISSRLFVPVPCATECSERSVNIYHSARISYPLLHIQVSAGDESRMAGAEMSCMAGAEMSCMAGVEVSRMAGDGDVLYGRR